MTLASKLLYWSRKALKKIDLFPTSNFIRYNGQSDYTTATGGFVSIAILIVLAVLFAQMALKTIDKEIISYSVQQLVDADPPPITIETSPESNFMFAISLFGFDLNDPYSRLFNITLAQLFFDYGYRPINQTMVPLQPCTIQHFSFGKGIQEIFTKFNMTRSLCPPIGYDFSVGGKIVSDVQSVFTIVVDNCDASVDPYCVNSTVFSNIQNSIQQFTLIVPVINVQLNPGSSDYKSYYLQDRNYFQFDSHLGNNALANLQQIVVNTDVSIMPYQDIVTQYFTVLPQTFTNVPYYKTSDRPYAKVMFSKAPYTTTYTRGFNKIDAYFSYIGGLVGTIIGLIFILNIYTQKAYEISISHKLFKDAEGNSINSSSFNIFYFITMAIKDILSYFCCNLNWPKTQTFMDCCQQISFQLDICYILKKIMFLQTAVEVLFKQEQISTLHLKEKYSIQIAKQKRRKYFTNQIVDNQNLMKINVENHNKQFRIANAKENELSVHSQNQHNSEIIQNIEDFSAISFSRRSKDRKDCKHDLNTILRDANQGDKLSKRIIEQVDTRFYSQTAIKYENQNGQPDHQQIVFQQLQQRGIQNKKQPIYQVTELQNFDFQI